MPLPGQQRKRAAAALSQAGRQSANMRHSAGRPHTPAADRMYATDVRETDVRQHNRLMPPWAGAE